MHIKQLTHLEKTFYLCMHKIYISIYCLLHVAGISDKMIAQFILGLAKSAKSPADYIEKLRETDAVDINEQMVSFSQELFAKVRAFVVLCVSRNIICIWIRDVTVSYIKLLLEMRFYT